MPKPWTKVIASQYHHLFKRPQSIQPMCRGRRRMARSAATTNAPPKTPIMQTKNITPHVRFFRSRQSTAAVIGIKKLPNGRTLNCRKSPVGMLVSLLVHAPSLGAMAGETKSPVLADCSRMHSQRDQSFVSIECAIHRFIWRPLGMTSAPQA